MAVSSENSAQQMKLKDHAVDNVEVTNIIGLLQAHTPKIKEKLNGRIEAA